MNNRRTHAISKQNAMMIVCKFIPYRAESGVSTNFSYSNDFAPFLLIYLGATTWNGILL